jgi:HTH-type transcriptional regulator / antitoxin HipB
MYRNGGGRMRIRTATDLGAFIRERRTKLGMDQISLAKKAGTSRKWLVEVEQGKPRAEIGLILRTLKSLEISIDVEADSPVETSSQVKLLVERRSQGDYAVRRPDSERASDVLPTQSEAIERARELNPKAKTPDINSVLDSLKKRPLKKQI